MTEMPLQSIRAPYTPDQDPSGCPLPTSLRRKEITWQFQNRHPKQKHSSACPNCGTEMVILRIKPILFGWKFEDLTLA